MNYFFVLSFIWYAIASLDTPKYNYEVVALHECSNQKGNWTLHGVWPEYDTGHWPSYCNYGSPLDMDILEPLLARLNTDWSDCYCNPDQTCTGLWSHEWSKHGTCSRYFPDQYGYFLEGLERYTDLASRGWLDHCPNRKGDNCYFYWDPWKEIWIDV